MSRQPTFTDMEYANRKRKTRREEFLERMDEIIPWGVFIELVRPYYPETGRRGRQPRGIETMLRMLFLQVWFSLSDEGVEDALYDSYAFRKFTHIDFASDEQAPDATTLLKFRHLLEEKELMKAMFDKVKDLLEESGCMMRGGTIADATIIQAPSSTKNEKGERDPEMRSTKKGNDWHFGMKAHIGVDAATGYVHTVTATAANAHDVSEAHNLVREDDELFSGDAGYIGVEKRDDFMEKATSVKVVRVNRKIGKVRQLPTWHPDKAIEKRKSSLRAKVEHPFKIVKHQYGLCKTVYRGIKKNLARLHLAFMGANLLMCSMAGGMVTHAVQKG